MWKFLLASLLLAAPVFAEENTKDTKDTKAAEYTAALQHQILPRVSVGFAWYHRSWRELEISDRTQIAYSDYSDFRLLSRIANAVSGTCIKTGKIKDVYDSLNNTSKLNLDSTGAYTVAAHTAETSHVTFALTSYTLRTDDRGNPVWVVTLADRSNRPVGTIHIRASDGRISRVEGMYQGRNMEQVEVNPESAENPPPVENDEQVQNDDENPENPVFKDVKRMFNRTTRDASRTFQKVRRSFVDFFNR